MMEDHEFCDDCPGCRPALADFDPVTGQVKGTLPQDHPVMVIVNRIWDNETTFAQRKAFIEVTLHNCRNEHEMRLFDEVQQTIQEALANG